MLGLEPGPADAEDRANERHVRLYRRWSEGGAGLLLTGNVMVDRRFLERPGPVEKVVVFSTTSTLTKQTSRDRHERAQIEAIAADERVLNDLCLERGIDLVLLRPTLVYGCGLDRNVSLLLKLGERSGFIPLSSQADGLRQPVHAEDLDLANTEDIDLGRVLGAPLLPLLADATVHHDDPLGVEPSNDWLRDARPVLDQGHTLDALDRLAEHELATKFLHRLANGGPDHRLAEPFHRAA